jgi:hypothetical protein
VHSLSQSHREKSALRTAHRHTNDSRTHRQQGPLGHRSAQGLNG